MSDTKPLCKRRSANENAIVLLFKRYALIVIEIKGNL